MDAMDRTRARDALAHADLVIVVAGAGLDNAEGLNMARPDKHFKAAYGDLARDSGGRSILQGLGSPYSAFERRLAWGSRFAVEEYLGYEPSETMRAIRALVGDTDCFVATTNMDGHFVRAGFPDERVLEAEGSVRKLMCSKRCSDDLYASDDAVVALNASIDDGIVDEDLIPRCPHCGAFMRLAVDELRLAQPDCEATERMEAMNELIAAHRGGAIVVLEIGMPARNRLVKDPLLQMVADEPRATYIVITAGELAVPSEIAAKTVAFSGAIAQSVQELARDGVDQVD